MISWIRGCCKRPADPVQNWIDDKTHYEIKNSLSSLHKSIKFDLKSVAKVNCLFKNIKNCYINEDDIDAYQIKNEIDLVSKSIHYLDFRMITRKAIAMVELYGNYHKLDLINLLESVAEPSSQEKKLKKWRTISTDATRDITLLQKGSELKIKVEKKTERSCFIFEQMIPLNLSVYKNSSLNNTIQTVLCCTPAVLDDHSVHFLTACATWRDIVESCG